MRRDRSAAEFGALQAELDSWLTRRTALDCHHQYETQLAAVAGLIDGAASEVASAIVQLSLVPSLPEIYEQCRDFDRRALWLRRTWDYFREKFDQRDRDVFDLTLRAADEVVWSCHHQPLARLAAMTGDTVARPTPLPFIESRYALEAFPSTKIPRDLRMDLGFIQGYLEQLPVGIVRLPPVCAREPWWLVLVAHEVGHHLEEDLLPGGDLSSAWRAEIETAVRRGGADDEQASTWGAWSSEIFADVFSVLTAGPWALVALVDLELAPDGDMRRQRPRYPSPLVRLHLIAGVADAVGLAGAAILRERLPGLGDPSAEEARFIAKVIEVALAPLPGIEHDLPWLCAVDPDEFALGGRVDEWSRQLLGEQEVPEGSGIRAARLMACASLAAATTVSEIAAEHERKAASVRLAGRAFDAIARSRDTTHRAAATGVLDDDLGRRLGTDLAAIKPPAFDEDQEERSWYAD